MRLARSERPADGVDDVVAIEHADHRVDARRPLEQLRAVALHEAARDDDALDRRPPPCASMRLVDDLERLVLRRLEEAARVHDDRVRRVVVGDEVEPAAPASVPSIFSESTRFFGQPRLTNATVGTAAAGRAGSCDAVGGWGGDGLTGGDCRAMLPAPWTSHAPP